jgi:hypothetical protein
VRSTKTQWQQSWIYKHCSLERVIRVGHSGGSGNPWLRRLALLPLLSPYAAFFSSDAYDSITSLTFQWRESTVKSLCSSLQLVHPIDSTRGDIDVCGLLEHEPVLVLVANPCRRPHEDAAPKNQSMSYRRRYKLPVTTKPTLSMGTHVGKRNEYTENRALRRTVCCCPVLDRSGNA